MRKRTLLAIVALIIPVTLGWGAFHWGGHHWKTGDGAGFYAHLTLHGANPDVWKQAHPQAARTFVSTWPANVKPRKPKVTLEQRMARCNAVHCADDVIRYVFGDRAGRALQIAQCESGLRPYAVGDNGASIGLFQINQVWWHLGWVGGHDRLLNALHNTRVAYRISGKGTTWRAWTCDRIV